MSKKQKKTENVQDAHEAIRPTSILRTPEEVKDYLSKDEYKLYHLIYCRALASLMKDAKVEATSVTLFNNDYRFKTTGQILIFDGYLKVYSFYEYSNDKILPDLKEDNKIVSWGAVVSDISSGYVDTITYTLKDVGTTKLPVEVA